jgi:hypothetical protein
MVRLESERISLRNFASDLCVLYGLAVFFTAKAAKDLQRKANLTVVLNEFSFMLLAHNAYTYT